MDVMSAAPLVELGQVDPLVGKVRTALNVVGGDEFDEPLRQVLRGVQMNNDIPAHGMIDEYLLKWLKIPIV